VIVIEGVLSRSDTMRLALGHADTWDRITGEPPNPSGPPAPESVSEVLAASRGALKYKGW